MTPPRSRSTWTRRPHSPQPLSAAASRLATRGHFYGYLDDEGELTTEYELGSATARAPEDHLGDVCMPGDEWAYPDHDHASLMSTIHPSSFATCWGSGTCCYGYDSWFGYDLDFVRMTDIPPPEDDTDAPDEDTGSPTSEECEDIDDWRLDAYYLPCDTYAGFAEDCGEYDTAYFDAETLCCACGGGTTGDGTIDGWEPEEDDPTDPDEPVDDLEILGTWDADYARQYTFSNDAFYYLYTDDTYTGIPSEYTITHYDNDENYLIARHRRTAYSAAGRWGRYDWHVRADGEYFWCETAVEWTEEAAMAHPGPGEFPGGCGDWGWLWMY